MKLSKILLATALSSASVTSDARAQSTSPDSLLSLNRAAVGGNAWRDVAAIRTSGRIIAGGGSGTFTQVVDHQRGHRRVIVDMGALEDVSGFDGQLWDVQNGILTIIDLPSLVTDGVTQAYVARDGWWTSRDSATTRLLTNHTSADSGGDVIEVTPAGGSAIDLWIDRQSHLVTRTIAHTDGGAVSTTFSDWRVVDGVRLPFRQVQVDNTQQTTTIEVTSATVARQFDPDALTRPARDERARLVGPRSTVPFRYTAIDRGHVVVAGEIDGKPVTLIFDSGAANYLVPESAHRLGLQVGGGVNIGGVGTSSTTGGFAQIDRIAIGSAALRKQAVVVGPLPYLATHPRAGMRVDGLVGFEFLSGFRTTLDYEARTLAFAPFDAPTSRAGVTVSFYSDGHSIYAPLEVDGVRGLFRLDTGDGGTLTLFQTFAAAHDLYQSGGVGVVAAGGVGGTISTRSVTARQVRFGGATLRDVPVEMSATEAGAFASRSIAGNIGAGILDRFRITFDYRAHTLTLVPGHSVSSPFRKDRSGLSLNQSGPTEITVLSVAPGSAADSAGVRAGDAIIAVEGASVRAKQLGAFDLAPLRFGTRPFRLSIRRDGQTHQVTIRPHL